MPVVALPQAFLHIPLAHRALHDRSQRRPENSPAAIRAAVAAGYGIEIDVQLSADGQAMVFHDDDLDRLTAEKGPLHARSAADLGRILLHDSDDGIPTLPQVLALVAGRVPLLIEIKDQDRMSGPVKGVLEAATAKALASYHGPAAVMSFNPHSIIAMAALAPAIPRGLTTCGFDPKEWAPMPEVLCAALREIPDFTRAEASFISHDWTDLDRRRVTDLKAQGTPILCWTIKFPTAEAFARKIADNITFEGYAAPFTA
ncbi:glycerophosphodiester phosphodiesterase family protein [Rhodobacter ferrooxidans]|uniref:Glycerophosphoryl diester phosphodiesterase n=1 Tax=Rhodobacter ferrooxidans TaxID=371731 RepID=C8S4G0_9RHOB|nr:glycerophosphodiester phosphodiesterase family protein [Rhodobacter sp. SW2]EEW24127.1 glycerophosphoryl diester phosphodiesterase [Rhodobacter sp. SW2]